MNSFAIHVGAGILGLLCTVSAFGNQSRLEPAQQDELAEIRESLSEISTLLRRSEFDEAEEIIDDAESRLEGIIEDSGLPETHPAFRGLKTSIARNRHTLALRREPRGSRQQDQGVSFVRHVAPILNAYCVECHSDDPGGKLRLETFADIKRGGETGPLFTAGRPDRSLLMYRLLAAENQRMPKGGESLSRGELTVLSLWIQQGASYDGEDEDLELAELVNPPEELPPLEFARPTGDETVSFKEDIAPFMVQYCLRCHQGKDPEGELSLVDFESFMRGGGNGPPVVPGDPEASLVFQLMGSFDEGMRMPLEGKVREQNYEDMGTWISEGARYDGEDPRLSLRALNPSARQLLASELTTLTPEEFISYREGRTAAQWQEAFPDEAPQMVSNEDVLVYGNVSEERLEEVLEWSVESFESLRLLFNVAEDELLWKGRLALFVIKDRDGYEHFNQIVTHRRIFPETFANMQVMDTFGEAFVVFQDVGDEPSTGSPTLRFSMFEQLTTAYLAPSLNSYPEWLSLGLGPALGGIEADRRDEYILALRDSARESLEDLDQPTDVFRDGAFFSSDQTRPVGFTLVDFLLKRGGQRKLAELFRLLEENGEIANSIRTVYNADLEPIARSYYSSFRGRR